MGRELESEEIDGFVYEMQLLGGKQGLHFMLKVLKVIGPAGGRIIDAAASKGSISGVLDAEVGPEGFSGAIESFVDRCSESELDYVVDKMSANCTVRIEGSKEQLSNVFDVHFQGRQISLLKWLKWAVWTQLAKQLSDSTLETAAVESLGLKAASA